MILEVIGIVMGSIFGLVFLYLAIVTFFPSFKVPEQPIKKTNPVTGEMYKGPPGSREEVDFNVKGTSISAWLYLPQNLSAPVPCIVMGHGFGGTKDMGLESYAVRYQEAGFAVLVFDYRYFGKSEGEPRQLLWIPYQLEDWSAAITYARGRKEIDPERIALWGTSMSGGHVIVLAARDTRIACVVAQCPGLDGRASAEMLFKRAGIGYLLRMVMHGQRDYFRSWFGLSPHKVPIVGKPGTTACLTTSDAYSGYKELAPESFLNEVCARILLRGDKYRPIKHARNVRSPVLLQVCENDSIVPKSAAEETEKRLEKHAEAVYYPIGHFDIYVGDHFERAVEDQLGFFRKHL
jgi:fermentation-respiration switch protein FrsA (DUF1100 family)